MVTSENAEDVWAKEIIDGFTFYRRTADEATNGRAAEARDVGGSAEPLPPVLLLNGCAMAAAAWMPVIERLPGREILALDRPGFAGTDWTGGVPDLASEIATAARIITKRGTNLTRPVIVVAHSMASFRAEALVRLRPELVAGIVLVDPSIEGHSHRGIASTFGSASWLRSLDAVTSPAEIRALAAHVSHRGFLRQTVSARALDWDVFKDPYAQPETLKATVAEWLSYRQQAADLTALRGTTMRVSAPASAIFASPFPNRRRAALLEASFAHLRRVDLEDSGHLMMIDRPDEIVRAVEDHSI